MTHIGRPKTNENYIPGYAKRYEGFKGWHGIDYPTFIIHKGRRIEIKNYNEHHDIIKSIFK